MGPAAASAKRSRNPLTCRGFIAANPFPTRSISHGPDPFRQDRRHPGDRRRRTDRTERTDEGAEGCRGGGRDRVVEGRRIPGLRPSDAGREGHGGQGGGGGGRLGLFGAAAAGRGGQSRPVARRCGCGGLRAGLLRCGQAGRRHLSRALAADRGGGGRGASDDGLREHPHRPEERRGRCGQ